MRTDGRGGAKEKIQHGSFCPGAAAPCGRPPEEGLGFRSIFLPSQHVVHVCLLVGPGRQQLATRADVPFRRP